MEKIRWGIISTAGINKALLDPIRQAERSELMAVASRDLDKAKAYAAKENMPKAYGSYEEMLADPEIDVVYNPLPNLLHAEWTIKAANAGKHVLCEKPLVTTMEHFEQVVAAATRNNVTVFEAFMYLHHPQTLKVQEMISEGKLGTLQQITSQFHFYLDPANSDNIRLSAPLHGGCTWDVGVYPHSMALTMAQASGAGDVPEEVYAHQIVGETGVDVAMRVQMRYANGLSAQISSGFRTPFREGTDLIGSDGALHVAEPWKPGLSGNESRIVFNHRTGGSTNIVTPRIDPYLCEVQAMEACILDGAALVVPLSQSRNFLRTVLASYESAQTGQPVRL